MNPDFHVRSAMGVGIAGVALLAPFSLNHLGHGRTLLGVGTLGIAALLALIAWMGSRGRYHPWLTFGALTPALLIFLTVAFREQGVIGALWCYPAVLVFYFTLPEILAWISNGTLVAAALPVAWNVLEPAVAPRFAATLVGVSVFSAIFVRVITRQQQALADRAVTDPLTGLHNRTLLGSTLEQAIEQAQRADIPMALLALDLDGFKGINDRYGHATGDDVLRGVADVLRTRLRRSDRAFRLGGEEFLAFLYNTDEAHARQVAEELRTAIAGKILLPTETVTASVGVASLSGGEGWEDWMRRSDERLYDAKARGRNRVA